MTRGFADRPIRHKIAVVIMLISGSAVLCACAGLLVYQYYSTRDHMTRRLEAMATIVGDQATAALEFEQAEDADAILRPLRAEPQIAVFALYDRNGVPFAQFLGEGVDASAVPSRPAPDGGRFAGGSFVLFAPVVSAGDRIGTLYLRSDLGQLRRQLVVNLVTAFALLVVLTLVVVAVSAKVGHRIAKPILALADVVQKVRESKNYSLRAAAGPRDETGRLIDGFNDMLSRIEERDAALAAARDDLERRVAERTRELEQENAERKAAEVRLREKDDLLTEAQDIAQLGSWEWNVATSRVTWSDEVHRLVGVMPARFGGDYASFVRCAHPDDRAAVDEALQTANEQREAFSIEFRIVRPDGAIRHVHMRGKVVLGDDRRASRIVGTLQDVTARTQAERAMQKLNSDLQASMADLAAANKELEGFSYSVSHDLRAPLRAIAGFSRMLLEDYGERVDAEGKRYIDVIVKNVNKMSQLIDDLLAFSQLGRKQLLKTSVDMQRLVEEIVAEHREAEPERAIEVRVGELPPAFGDPAMLRQAVFNLVSNALKYSRGSNPSVVEVDGTATDQETTYRVRDNGVGFDMAYADKLFGVFQRLHAASEFEGTGVGLALVQRVVQRHGGRVRAEGKVGQGATFEFSLPRSDAHRAEVAGAPRQRANDR